MLAVTQGIVPILVDCSADGQNAELMQQYSVQGFPTVIYTDPNGEQIKEMAGREPAAVQQDVENLIKKYPGRPSMWANSQHAGIEGAKKAKKPVAIYVVDEKADLAKELARLQKDVADRKTKFVWVLQSGNPDSIGLKSAPGVVVLDPKLDKPELEPLAVIEMKDVKADALNKQLDEILKNFKK